MRHKIVQGFFLSAVIVAGVTLACNQPDTRNPAAPSAPGVASLDIIGPDSVSPGQSVQLSVSVRLADGTVKTNADTTTVLWRTSSPGVLAVSPAGVVTAVAQQGEATITAEVRVGNSSRLKSRSLVVLPAGTFRLVGQVNEVDPPHALIPGARVEVSSGSPFAIADSQGQYRLYGVPPSSEINVSAAGYTSQTFPVQLTANSTRDFTLSLSGPRLDLAGNYTLFIDAPTCSGSQTVPSEFRHRSYLAVVTQKGPFLTVTLTEPRFNLKVNGKGNNFTGISKSGGASFNLDSYSPTYYYYYVQYPSVVERLPDGRNLVAAGSVFASGSSAGLSGTLTGGGFVLFDSRFPTTAFIVGSCSDPLQFRLEPR